MPEWLSHPLDIGLMIMLALLAAFFGRMRRDPPLAIAASAAGVTFFWAGLRWAGFLGQDATGALFLGSLGIILSAWAQDRAKAAKVGRAAQEQT